MQCTAWCQSTDHKYDPHHGCRHGVNFEPGKVRTLCALLMPMLNYGFACSAQVHTKACKQPETACGMPVAPILHHMFSVCSLSGCAIQVASCAQVVVQMDPTALVETSSALDTLTRV